MDWCVKAIRGATTVEENTVEAMTEAVKELLTELEIRNRLDPDRIISAIFTATRDLDAIFPAAIARKHFHWDNVALMDVQQMHVEGSLPRCIRFMVHVSLPVNVDVYHPYLRGASILRPDLAEAHHLHPLVS